MYFFSARSMSYWRGEAQMLALGGKIKLPSQPRDCVSLAHKEAVAVLALPAIRQEDNSTTATIGDFKQHRAVSFAYVLGLEQIKVGRKLDFAMRIPWGFFQIYDLAIVRVRRIKCEEHLANDL